MTQEQKAKAYDEAFNRAKSWYTDAQIDFKKSLETLFPELKCDDEKIRKEIIKCVKNYGPSSANPQLFKNMLAWLEKQKTIDVLDKEEREFADNVDSYRKDMDEFYKKGYNAGREAEKQYWLEKQGEHKRFRDSIQIGDSVTKNEYDELVNLSQLNRVAKRDADILKKQSEQKSTTIDVDKMVSDYASHNEKRNEIFGKPVPCMVRAYKQGICDTLESLGEEKPFEKEFTLKAIPRLLDMIEPSDRAKAYCQKLIDTLAKEGYNTDAKIVEGVLKGWNGEDVPMAVMDEKQGEQKPDSFCREHCKGFQETGKCFADGDCKAKREAEQKPAWGEEDENTIKVLMNIIRKSEVIDSIIYTDSLKEKLYDWLNSLKYRYIWKPSDDQIKALAWALSLAKNCGEECAFDLRTLYEQLEKLKG